MAEQTGRQPFLFRLPWVTIAAPTPPPAQIEPQQSPPTQPTTTNSNQRPPFRPPGSAPLQPRPQSRVQMSTETQKPPSPNSTAPQSRDASQPPSPSRKVSRSQSATQAASQPQSPSRTISQSQTATRMASQLPSRSRRASRPQPALQTASQLQPPQTGTRPARQTSSQPPSPSRTASQGQPKTQAASLSPSPSKKIPQTQPTAQASSQPQSPSKHIRKLQPTIRASSQPSPALKGSQASPLTSFASQHEPSSGKASQMQSALSKSLPREPQSAETTSEPVSYPQNQTTMQAMYQTDGMAKQPSRVTGFVAADTSTSIADPKTRVQQQKSDSAITVAPRQPPKSETSSEDNREEKQKVKSEPKKEEKSNGSVEEPKPMMITEPPNMASGSNTQTKGQSAVTSQAEQKQMENQPILNKKEMATGFKGRESKTVAINLKDKNTASESHRKSTTYNGERAALHKEIKEDVSRFVHKLAVEPSKESIDESPVSVITLAGENRGAAMNMGSETAKREGSVPIHRGYKLNKADNAEDTTDGEGSSKGRRLNDKREHTGNMAYINSNIQSINNSIVYDSSITERNPGVHLVLSCNSAEPIKSNHETESIEARKADLNITPTQTLTFKPTVRRRCLRSLFMEPSDSDLDNPEKPRRHGCRYNCKEMSRDNGNGASTTM